MVVPFAEFLSRIDAKHVEILVTPGQRLSEAKEAMTDAVLELSMKEVARGTSEEAAHFEARFRASRVAIVRDHLVPWACV